MNRMTNPYMVRLTKRRIALIQMERSLELLEAQEHGYARKSITSRFVAFCVVVPAAA
jgi:hypothetical protein